MARHFSNLPPKPESCPNLNLAKKQVWREDRRDDDRTSLNLTFFQSFKHCNANINNQELIDDDNDNDFLKILVLSGASSSRFGGIHQSASL